MYIPELTMPDFITGLTRTKTVVVPFGSTEEHGQHLPLDTDTLQALTVARKAAERRPLFVAPPLHYGVCRSTGQHPGTISISTATLRAFTLDICNALYRHGLRDFVLFSGHAGVTHNAVLIDAGEEFLAEHDNVRVAVVTEYQLANREGKGVIETPGDSHAGEIETSRILFSHPHLVKGTSPRETPSFPEGILVRDKLAYWPGGVWGDPEKASSVKGSVIEDLVIAALCRLIEQLEGSSWR